MATFTVHTPDSAPEASRDRLAAIGAAWGFIPALHGMLAESPEALEGYDALFGLVSRSSLLSTEQQVAYLAVSVLHGCEYCTAGHTFLARTVGLDEASIQAVRDERPIADARLQALRLFVEAVAGERGRVGDAAVDAFLAAGFTRQQVLEVVLVVATKTISNYVNHITHTPQEGFMADPALRWIAPRGGRLAA